MKLPDSHITRNTSNAFAWLQLCDVSKVPKNAQFVIHEGIMLSMLSSQTCKLGHVCRARPQHSQHYTADYSAAKEHIFVAEHVDGTAWTLT